MHYREGKKVDQTGPAKGERLYLTWCYDEKRRVVKTMADGASLNAIQAEGQAVVEPGVEVAGAFPVADDAEDVELAHPVRSRQADSRSAADELQRTAQEGLRTQQHPTALALARTASGPGR